MIYAEVKSNNYSVQAWFDLRSTMVLPSGLSILQHIPFIPVKNVRQSWFTCKSDSRLGSTLNRRRFKA